ncbi:MAG: sugar phosphate nucleotidyltransferase [Rhodobacteraceae bacterium]|jgi:UTP--glucose-1-phosphate uridylyltransferase|nr:sugar phosphate nucleotidyltransferase [Paracoccaceae bacterium]
MRASAIRTAILPVAGLGTRLLPATKTVPKELLPVYDTPLLQFAIDEASSIPGVERLVVVTHPSKDALVRYFEDAPALADKLRRQQKDDLAGTLESTGAVPGLDIRFVHQEEALGLGHAVLCAAEEAAEGPVAVILPDDLILPATCMADMATAYNPDRAEMMVAAMPVEPAEIARYGAFDVASRLGPILQTRGIVEKPAPGTAPSLYAAVGRYILPGRIFAALRNTRPGHQGEIQLTDAIAALCAEGGLEGFCFTGERFDCGTHDGLLAAGNRWRAAREAGHTGAVVAAQ